MKILKLKKKKSTFNATKEHSFNNLKMQLSVSDYDETKKSYTMQC